MEVRRAQEIIEQRVSRGEKAAVSTQLSGRGGEDPDRLVAEQ